MNPRYSSQVESHSEFHIFLPCLPEPCFHTSCWVSAVKPWRSFGGAMVSWICCSTINPSSHHPIISSLIVSHFEGPELWKLRNVKPVGPAVLQYTGGCNGAVQCFRAFPITKRCHPQTPTRLSMMIVDDLNPGFASISHH